MNPRRIGVFGGTFDPFHNGHLALARVALERLELDRLEVFPAAIPPERNAPHASIRHRLAMARAALSDTPAAFVSELDARHQRPAFTANLLRRLRRDNPGDELVLLLGSDLADAVPSWREGERIGELATIAVVGRPGLTEARATIGSSGETAAATLIRARLAAGEDIANLVPPAVRRYIERHKLYSRI